MVTPPEANFQPQTRDTTNGPHLHTYIPRSDGSILVGGVVYIPQASGTVIGATTVPLGAAAAVPVVSQPVQFPPLYTHCVSPYIGYQAASVPAQQLHLSNKQLSRRITDNRFLGTNSSRLPTTSSRPPSHARPTSNASTNLPTVHDPTAARHQRSPCLQHPATSLRHLGLDRQRAHRSTNVPRSELQHEQEAGDEAR